MRYNIVASCDNAFAQHATVMLTSLMFHHQDQSFNVFILVPSSFSDDNKTKISDSLSRWGHNLKFISIDESECWGLKVNGHVSAATYYRLYMPALLPNDIKTALYLDADVIVNGSIVDLLDTDVSGHFLAAVPDASVDKNETVRAKLHLDKTARYLNAGVLLLNLERWRSEKIGVRALKFCEENPESITYWDQCAINYVIQGNYVSLHRKWNFQLDHMSRVSTYRFHSSSINEARAAAIIHFTTDDKPWRFLCAHPSKELYFKYLEYTLWRDFAEPDRTPRNVVKKYIGFYFPSASRRLKAIYNRCKGLLHATGRAAG